MLKTRRKSDAFTLIKKQARPVWIGIDWAAPEGSDITVADRDSRGGATRAVASLPVCVTPCSDFGFVEVSK